MQSCSWVTKGFFFRVRDTVMLRGGVAKATLRRVWGFNMNPNDQRTLQHIGNQPEFVYSPRLHASTTSHREVLRLGAQECNAGINFTALLRKAGNSTNLQKGILQGQHDRAKPRAEYRGNSVGAFLTCWFRFTREGLQMSASTVSSKEVLP